MTTARTFLSETQARRLATIAAVAAEGGTQGEAATRCELSRQGLVGFLWRELGNGHWPPSIHALAARRALPVLSDKEARRKWTGEGKTRSELEREADRTAPAPGLPRVDGGPVLPDHEIHTRRMARVDERAAHEAHWLTAEREKYGETKQTRARPLSRMVA